MLKNIVSCLVISLLLVSCAGDLSSDVYSSSSTMGLTLKGKVIDKSPIKIKETERFSDNSAGLLLGGAAGGIAASNATNGNDIAVIGGAIVAGLFTAVAQDKLGTSNGFQYIVEVDKSTLGDNYYEGSRIMRDIVSSARTSGILTIIQNIKNELSLGDNVYVIVTERRARIVKSSN